MDRKTKWQQQAPRTLGMILIALLLVLLTLVRYWRVMHWGLR